MERCFFRAGACAACGFGVLVGVLLLLLEPEEPVEPAEATLEGMELVLRCPLPFFFPPLLGGFPLGPLSAKISFKKLLSDASILSCFRRQAAPSRSA